jgi:hypothetical protein
LRKNEKKANFLPLFKENKKLFHLSAYTIAAARQRELKAGHFTPVYLFQRLKCCNFDYSLYFVVFKAILLNILIFVAAILRQT